jgi:hypothetical protein
MKFNEDEKIPVNDRRVLAENQILKNQNDKKEPKKYFG